jgi:thiol-disulfide isomerase/thioredoxin
VASGDEKLNPFPTPGIFAGAARAFRRASTARAGAARRTGPAATTTHAAAPSRCVVERSGFSHAVPTPTHSQQPLRGRASAHMWRLSRGVVLLVALTVTACRSSSIGLDDTPPPPPLEDPPNWGGGVRSAWAGRGRLPLVGASAVIMGTVPACRRVVVGSVQQLLRLPRKASTHSEESSSANCEDGVCEIPHQLPEEEAEASSERTLRMQEEEERLMQEETFDAVAHQATFVAAEDYIARETDDDDDQVPPSSVLADEITASAGAPDEPGVEEVNVEMEGAADSEGGEDSDAVEAAPSPADPPVTLSPSQRFCRALSALQEEIAAAGGDSSSSFPAAAKLIARYCANAAKTPPMPKHRRIRFANAVFQRVLGPFPAGVECLRAVGFVDGQDDQGGSLLVMGTAEPAALDAAAESALARIALLEAWPEALHAHLPSLCIVLEGASESLERLTSELSAAHVPQLLAHEDNLQKVAAQLSDVEAVDQLVEQLSEVRVNLTRSSAGVGASAGARVRHVADREDWYDLLMDAKGLVVCDFSASWCGPCQHVKPLFEELSGRDEFRAVTFVSVDADENPTIVGENQVSSFPTFKFFLNSAEEDLPVEGADIEQVESKIIEILARY